MKDDIENGPSDTCVLFVSFVVKSPERIFMRTRQQLRMLISGNAPSQLV